MEIDGVMTCKWTGYGHKIWTQDTGGPHAYSLVDVDAERRLRGMVPFHRVIGADAGSTSYQRGVKACPKK